MLHEIDAFMNANPELTNMIVKYLLEIVGGAVLGWLSAHGYITKSARAKARAMLADGKTATQVTDGTRLMIGEVEKIAAKVAKKAGK